MRRLAIGLVRLYQWCVSPVLVAIWGNSCRFTPSCSQYAIEAIDKHGVVRGFAYAASRIARCQPLCKGGFDPVP